MAALNLTSFNDPSIPDGYTVSVDVTNPRDCRWTVKLGRRTLSGHTQWGDSKSAIRAAVSAILLAMPRDQAIVASVQTGKYSFEQACDAYQPNQEELGIAFDKLLAMGLLAQ